MIQVANMTLQDVIKNRELVRDVARDSMLKVVKGWGVWLETVEITDVKVLSKYGPLKLSAQCNLC